MGSGNWPYIATPIPNDDGSGPERMQAAVLAVSSIGFIQYLHMEGRGVERREKSI